MYIEPTSIVKCFTKNGFLKKKKVPREANHAHCVRMIKIQEKSLGHVIFKHDYISYMETMKSHPLGISGYSPSFGRSPAISTKKRKQLYMVGIICQYEFGHDFSKSETIKKYKHLLDSIQKYYKTKQNISMIKIDELPTHNLFYEIYTGSTGEKIPRNSELKIIAESLQHVIDCWEKEKCN